MKLRMNMGLAVVSAVTVSVAALVCADFALPSLPAGHKAAVVASSAPTTPPPMVTPIVAAVTVTAAPSYPYPAERHFLNDIRQAYFARKFTDQQLVHEGHRVCDAAGQASDDTIMGMVSSDMGISIDAAQSFVANAHMGLGC